MATIRIARALAPEGYGLWGIVQTIATLGVVFAGLGLRHVIIRECARYPEKSKSLFFSSAILQLLAIIPVAIGIILYGTYLSNDLPLILSMTAVCLFSGLLLWELIESIAFGHERMGFSALLNIGGSIVWVAFAWLSPASFLTPESVCISFAVLQGIKTCGYFLAIKKNNLFQKEIYISQCKYLYRNGLPFYWLALLTAATNQLPILFLAARSGAFDVGLYNAGYKLTRPMHIMIMTLMLSIYPGLSRMKVMDSEQYLNVVRRSLLSIALVGSGFASFISLFRFEIVTLLFGTNFRQAIMPVAFQVWYTVLLGIFNLIGTALAASDRQGLIARLVTLYTAVAIPLLWIGSDYGATGLAAAILAAAGINMTYHLFYFQKSLPEPLPSSFFFAIFGVIGISMTFTLSMSQAIPLSIRLLAYLLFTSTLTWLTFRFFKLSHPKNRSICS